MAQSPVLDALASFQTRTAYGCVEHDIPVGFESAVFVREARLDRIHRSSDQGHSEFHAYDPAAFQLPVLTASAEEAGHLKQVEAIHAGLNSLTWTKVAIFPSRPFFAHEDVIVQTELWQVQFGSAVIQDIVERLLA